MKKKSIFVEIVKCKRCKESGRDTAKKEVSIDFRGGALTYGGS